MATSEAFSRLIGDHGGRLRRIARVYAGRDDEDQDLYQEMLFQLWRGLPTFRGDSALGTWVYRVALNTALTWRRKASRRHQVEMPSLEEELHPRTSGAPGSEEAILDEFLASLNPVDRSVLILYMEGLTNPQIAEITGTSTGAIAVRIHRIKQAFKDRYVSP